MKTLRRTGLAFAVWAGLMPAGLLADTALIIANGRYDAAQSLRESGEIARLEAPLTANGFEVIVVENGSAEAMRAGVSALLRAEETGRVLIAVAGHVAHADADTWLLASDAGVATGGRVDLGTVGGAGVAMSVLLEIAGQAPGRAAVLIAQERRRIDFGPGLDWGIGRLEPPQGVTVITGPAPDLAAFAQDVLLRPGADVAAGLAAARRLRGLGFIAAAMPFSPIGDGYGAGVAPPVASQEERALWDAVRELNTPGAYDAYLTQYPQGAFAAEARARRDVLQNAENADPAAEQAAAEAALGLDADGRREVQRFLTILGFDTRGIDGIFGRGTRGAIRAWQQANGFEATGFLTARQLLLLRERGGARAAQIAEEERRAEEARARADDAFWQATGFGRTEAGLRQYLDRYPDGRHAAEARARLDRIEADRRAEAEAAERADWDRVRRRDTVEAYLQYLDRYPNGLFAEFARDRIDFLRGQGMGDGLSDAERAQAEAREAALNLPQVTRLLVERRLAALGLDPGRVDGEFDTQTRRAIAAYQGSRGMRVTGYLEQITVVRLLAEALGGTLFE
jgi:peptidoglycan hydrolase-like protein with peptidoglycan-binding domain